MANHDALLQEWVKEAQGYLPEHLAYRKDPKKGEEIYTVTYKGKKWRLLYSDLEQLASDLNIFDKMYPSTDAVPVVQEAQPETFVVFNPDNDMWFLTVMGVTFCVSGEIAGKMLNAGCEYRKYQPR